MLDKSNMDWDLLFSFFISRFELRHPPAPSQIHFLLKIEFSLLRQEKTGTVENVCE